ncbi:Small RNA 2'-O-methyltransferase OS=Tsukamurella paurometabola (strain ATCC 8368 / DSM / CCUG 35730 / CIP 100753 / JCM 10117 / KCTC 9821 / NBRC 16120 /NCIMB 702349 / NCTC 13040) OX=521096 GN=Tpau_0482 PE=3 SV=1 [Tsukamurella paurometabola]|uniref:Small RNA 2'-O-methyltransferase n=1 Tax=Tsukamurella paurometabola (strain ATCC 8368 / DSM 20162 / CCUG 35730 / CIP 100753 / JCM 10117 / KCTC 9821 / NBRC 16120 / NCIMB 702349 / NCTC 13040) TaxID=521096 RepID=D5US56_TSUPD|nr:Methyltransferase type 12 [Tsukamurella paurometabola DSM 20162]SUP42861.1 bifunctional 3-demethylubiquinone-9 3-methyltransferase/ 2-octaprenyl-6-hydroxy phenol methylase [Tsukamurella paurometabola]
MQTDRVYLTISTTYAPATELGYLLHKHPDRVQEFRQPFGVATVFYPEAGPDRCTAALLLEVDPIQLAKRRRASPDFSLGQYVNDRPYAASSLLAAALADVFRSARHGRAGSRQELADTAIPLQIEIPVLPCRGGAEVAERVFAPLGWDVDATPIELDGGFPEWGQSRYVRLRLTGRMRLAEAINHLYVLLPVLDESKHYWQGPDEVDKLLRSGEGWLASHPDRELITRRYLGRGPGLAAEALDRLAALDDAGPAAAEVDEAVDIAPAKPLNALRHDAVHRVIVESGASTVIDLGCGPGQFVERLLATRGIERVAGCDVSTRSLQRAAQRLHLDDMTERQRERIDLFQAALTYEDERLSGYDAAVLMEVIEHVDPSRLGALEHVVFGGARPGTVIVTTPNSEYNVLYPDLVGMRHTDHRFEWDRTEFIRWSTAIAERYGYAVRHEGIGEADPDRGTPTQMAIFTRKESADA